MWDWFVNNGIWILIAASIVVVLLLIFSDKVRALISKLAPDKWERRFTHGVTSIFWTIEGIAVVLMIAACVAITLSTEGIGAVITPERLQTWFLEHGLRVVIILVVGIVLWIVMKQTLPPLVNRIMARSG